MSGLPTSWADIELSVVAQVTSGIGFPNEYQGHTSGDLPFFKVSDISHAVLANRGELKTANHYVSHEVAEKLKGKPLAPGSTVFAKIGEAVRLNRRATVTTPCLIDNNVMAVKARDGVDDRYVYQFLRTIDFGESARSTTVPSLRKGDVEELRFPLAPAAEQKRIADKLDTVLTRVDAVNTRLARVAPLLKRFRQSVLAAATSGRLTEDWRHQRGKQWSPTLKKVSDIGDVVTGNTPSKKIDDAFGGQWLFVKPGDLDLGYRVLDTSEKLTDLGAGMSRVLPELTVLVTCIGATIGKTGLLRRSGATNQQINAVVCKGTVLPEWLYFWFLSPIGQSAVIENSSATTLPILNKSRFSALELEIPSIDEQTEIVRRVETLFAFADRLETRLAQAQTAATRLTPALLAKAFRGELVPQDPNDEPAAELLRRLLAERASAPKASTGRGRKAAVQV